MFHLLIWVDVSRWRRVWWWSNNANEHMQHGHCECILIPKTYHMCMGLDVSSLMSTHYLKGRIIGLIHVVIISNINTHISKCKTLMSHAKHHRVTCPKIVYTNIIKYNLICVQPLGTVIPGLFKFECANIFININPTIPLAIDHRPKKQ